MVRKGQVIFALTNPAAEIDPDAALAAGAAFAADGTSINNVLGYPGIFKGALLAGASEINLEMKRAAAWALAGLTVVSELIPEVLDRKVHEVVAEAVRQAAIESGVADQRRTAGRAIRRDGAVGRRSSTFETCMARASGSIGTATATCSTSPNVDDAASRPPARCSSRSGQPAINPGEASIRMGLLHERFPSTFPSGRAPIWPDSSPPSAMA